MMQVVEHRRQLFEAVLEAYPDVLATHKDMIRTWRVRLRL